MSVDDEQEHIIYICERWISEEFEKEGMFSDQAPALCLDAHQLFPGCFFFELSDGVFGRLSKNCFPFLLRCHDPYLFLYIVYARARVSSRVPAPEAMRTRKLEPADGAPRSTEECGMNHERGLVVF